MEEENVKMGVNGGPGGMWMRNEARIGEGYSVISLCGVMDGLGCSSSEQ